MDQHDFDEIAHEFEDTRDANGDPLNMHYFLIRDSADTYVHRFKGRTEESDIRSISKTVMALVTGIVVDLSCKGGGATITEETHVYPYLRNVVRLKNHENKKFLERVRVKHLLTHSIGFDEVLLMRNDIKDLDPYEYVNHIVNHPIVHEPGEHFLYSNAGCYLLSVFLQEVLQEDLLSFIERTMFAPLQIRDFRWEKYGNYLAGATRLWLLPEDLSKIGELMLQGGVWNGKAIVPSAWIKDHMLRMRFLTPLEDSPDATFRRYGYGLGTWLPKADFYFGHGTDGQILTVLPAHDMVIVTQAHQHDVKPIETIIDTLVVKELARKRARTATATGEMKTSVSETSPRARTSRP